MKRAIVAFAALFASACATVPNHDGRGHQVEIRWAGIYKASGVSPRPDSSGVINQQIGNPRLVERTATVPLKPGTRFGILYRVTDAPSYSVVRFRRIVRFPAPGARVKPDQPLLPYHQVDVSCETARDCMTGYGLDQPWEMMPGKWTIELWDRDRKVAEQSFTVVAR